MAKPTVVQGPHQTSGLSEFDYGGQHYHGFTALDIGGGNVPAGTAVTAPEPGHIVKISGHPTETGWHGGKGGAFGMSVYLLSLDGKRVYYLTHLNDNLTVRLGQEVASGQQLGALANLNAAGNVNHVHIAVGTLDGNTKYLLNSLAKRPGIVLEAAGPPVDVSAQPPRPADTQPATMPADAQPVAAVADTQPYQPPTPDLAPSSAFQYQPLAIPGLNIPGPPGPIQLPGPVQPYGSSNFQPNYGWIAQQWQTIAGQPYVSQDTLGIADLTQQAVTG